MMGFLGPRFWGLDNPGLAGPHSSRPSTHSRRPRFAIAPGPAPPAAFQRLSGAARTRERERAGGGPNGGAAPWPGRCLGLGGAHGRAARAYGKCRPGARVRRPRGGGGRLRERARRRPIALRATRDPRPREGHAPGSLS